VKELDRKKFGVRNSRLLLKVIGLFNHCIARKAFKHFVAIGKPEQQARKTPRCGSKQQ